MLKAGLVPGTVRGQLRPGVNCGRMCWGQTWKALVRMVKVVNIKV